jgi:hypothetical protein
MTSSTEYMARIPEAPRRVGAGRQGNRRRHRADPNRRCLMTDDDNVVVLDAIRAARAAEALRRAIAAGHPSAQFAVRDAVPPAPSAADPGVCGGTPGSHASGGRPTLLAVAFAAAVLALPAGTTQAGHTNTGGAPSTSTTSLDEPTPTLSSTSTTSTAPPPTSIDSSSASTTSTVTVVPPSTAPTSNASTVPATTAPAPSAPADSPTTPTTTLIGEPDGGCRTGTWPDCTPPTSNSGDAVLPATGADYAIAACWIALGCVVIGLVLIRRRWNGAGR